MAAPVFTALLKNLPTIISVGHGLYNLFTQTTASKKENDRVLEAFQLLRTHQDDLDHFLEDPERQRILMEGYTILMRRIRENNRGGGGGAAYRQLPPGLDNIEDNVPQYGTQRTGFGEMNNEYRGKDDFHDVFRGHGDYDRINDNRGRDGFRGMNDFPWRDDYRGRNGFGDDHRREGDRSNDYRGRNDGRDGVIGDYGQRGDDRDNRTRRVENDGRQKQARDCNLNKKSSKGALNKMKEQLVCDVCRGNYDIRQHRPTLMPTCGHTFCRACLREESRHRHLLCPVCRSDPFMDVNSLPTNQPLLQLVMEQEDNGSDDSSSSSCSPANTASCNNTRSSCSDDTPSCRNTQNSCADDSSCSESCGGDSLAILPFEEQIQLVLIMSREEMGRIEDDGHNPFAFLDELEANQGTGLTQAVRLIESNNNSLYDSGRTRGTCIEDEDEKEDLLRAIEMSLLIDTAEGYIGGMERCTVVQDDISRREVMQTREVLAQPSAPDLSEIQPNHHFGWDQESRRKREERVNEREELRRREREEMEREREELKRKKEEFKKEQEEWMRSQEQERNLEKAKNTLAALGCYGEDHEQMNGNRHRDDDDDCNRPQTKKTNSSSGKNNGGMYRDADCDDDDDDNCCSDDDVCCDKKDDCFKNSCSDDDDVGCDTKDDCFKNSCSDDDECSKEVCGAAATEPCDSNQTIDNKQYRSAFNLDDISEEELEKARIKQEKWDRRKRRNEEELQMALALSCSMHEAEMAQAPQDEDP